MDVKKYFDTKMCSITGFEMFKKEKNLSLSGIKYNPKYEEYDTGFFSKQNPNIIVMKYKSHDSEREEEFVFHKENAYSLYCAIVGEEFIRQNGITKKIFDNYCSANGTINVLEDNVKNSSFVLLTRKPEVDIKERHNITKTAITSLKDDLTFNTVFADRVEYEECYNYNSKNDELSY